MKKNCRECGDQLCRLEVHDVKANVAMGHYWKCYPCDVGYVGFGEAGEYNGKPGGLIPGEIEAKQP